MYTVLIVDDNREWCLALKDNFDKHDYFELVTYVNDGADAIRYIERSRPDVLIVDLIMPHYDGVYLINYIKHEVADYTPFIYVLSAIGADKSQKIMKNLDVDYYSVKPIVPEVVYHNIIDLLDIWREHEEPAAEEMPLHVEPFLSPNTSEKASIDLNRQIEDYLIDMGCNLYRKSSDCLRYALRLALLDAKLLNTMTRLYEEIRSRHYPLMKTGAIERNLRTAISSINRLNNLYYQQNFPEKITNTVFMTKSVYLLKLRIEDYLSDNVSIQRKSGIHSKG